MLQGDGNGFSLWGLRGGSSDLFAQLVWCKTVGQEQNLTFVPNLVWFCQILQTLTVSMNTSEMSQKFPKKLGYLTEIACIKTRAKEDPQPILEHSQNEKKTHTFTQIEGIRYFFYILWIQNDYLRQKIWSKFDTGVNLFYVYPIFFLLYSEIFLMKWCGIH